VESEKDESVVTDEVISKINSLVEEKTNEGYKVAVLTTKDKMSSYKCENIILLGEKGDGTTVASRLYAALRECDTIKADFIYSEGFNRDDFGGAIMNRLIKSAGHKVILV
ncbi:MAG: threonylcarbamoyl-AMP synthase, partial [Lachnospiraceae bacterium]|nr:threonylcarbamoyl-AMP synthase [Lachnospiraceae bacterium]